jgi:broad specificity phosphatase PhoE
MRLYLFRCGDVARTDVYFGQYDVPLAEAGQQQSAAIAEVIASLDVAAIYASDLSRSADTARLASKRTGLPFQTDARLRELHLGWAEGQARDEVARRDPALKELHFGALREQPFSSGGETLRMLADRVRRFRDEIVPRHRGRKVAVIGHHLPNRVLLGDALGLPLEGFFTFRQDRGRLSVIEYGESRARVALLNAEARPVIPSRPS